QFFKDMDPDLMLEDLFTSKHFSSKVIKDYIGEASFCTIQKRTLQLLFPEAVQSHRTAASPALSPHALQDILRIQGCSNSPSHDQTSFLSANDTAKCLGTAELDDDLITSEPDDAIPLTSNLSSSIKQNVDKAANYIQSRNLTPSQLSLTNPMFHYFQKLKENQHKYRRADLFRSMHTIEKLPAPLGLVTGDPGAGKSYGVNTIVEIPSILQLGCVAATSFNGIAAVNVDGGSLCSMFIVFDTSDNRTLLSSDALRKLRHDLNYEQLCCLIVDEVSTIDTRIIALLDCRLKQVMDNPDLPFGGLPVLFVGDFNQLGPVQKTFIPDSMMTWATRLYHKDISVQTSPLLRIPRPLSSSNNAAPSNPIVPSTKPKFSSIVPTFGSAFGNKATLTKEPRKQKVFAHRLAPSSLEYTGCSLLSTFRRYHFKEQQRSKDPEHNIFVQKLANCEPILPSDLLHYKPLSQQDIR
ncbi:MAG: AAA family ATPase, partial [Cetobacterium sp.]